ncbi:hypothetical protein EOD39_2808 [Acipenser ruthenus]|uniref:Uncharacterized protein n=1 Tax=Acipenser ruthenus TaxID=7906 RepID=A0A444TYC8_ACIRT|nr:hypothetical protein EOD39_2808 [Acipenser ruthenus]
MGTVARLTVPTTKEELKVQEGEESREALEGTRAAILLWRSKYRILDQGNRWENWKYGWEEEKTATQY